MAKFIEDRSSLKKKKKKENATQKAAPSSANKKQVSNIANQVVNRTANAAKRTTNTVGNSAQRQNTVRRNVQDSISRNAPQRYNNRPSGAAQPSTNHTVQDRLAASRQRREQAEADIKRRRQESEARSQRISQSRNPRMQDTQRGVKMQTEEERRQRQDRLRQAQEQKMGNNSMASKEAQKAANRAVKNTPTVVKESAKQVGIGHGKTLADITEANKSAAIGSKIDIKSKEFQEDIEKRRKESTRVAKSSFKTLSDMQEKSEQKLQDKTKDAKGLEKAYYGALESGVGMATDRLAGPAWAVSMLSRTYGNTRGQAQKEGATEDEDRAYSLLQAAKEVATEYMFQGVGLAKGLSGSKSLSLGEKAANALTKNMRGPLANATHAGIRLLGGVGEENAEEVAGWGLDPFIKEFTYGRNVRTRQAQQMMREQSDALRSNITSMDDARAIAAYLGSDDFLDSQIRTYMDSGIGKEEARDLAENMRDYLDASLSGDTEKMADIEESLSKKLSGRGVKDILKQDLSLSELKDTIASTTLLTATTGLPGTVTTAARGAAVKEQLGTDGIRALAKTAEDFEDGEMQLKAKAMSDRLDAGKDITNTQAYDLAVGVQEQYNKDADRQQTAYQTAQKTIKSERLVTPYRVSRDGDIQMDEVTDKTYQSTAKSAKSAIETFIENSEGKESLTDTEIDRGSRAIAGFKTGVFTVDDANELNFRNTAVRSAFEKETGVDLSEYVVKGKDGQIDIPATNTATKNALFAKAADNLVATAQAETANWVDNTKGEVVTQISRRMGASGTAALQTALDDVDERDRSSYMMTANASDVLYQSARNMGTEWENAKDYAKRMFPNVAEDKLKAMYEAGLADRDMATDEARGQQIKIGEKVELKKQSNVPTGQVIIETSAPVKGSVIRTFTELARNLGVDIHLVDHFTDENGKVLKNVNGEYIDGNIFINVNSDFEKNMGFIFMHEVTHHLKMYAPEQYKALENLVREKWFKYDSAQMQSEIAKKIETYAKHGQKLTEEQALEEIIADAAHEFLTDRNFAREIANEDATLAQAVLTSIRNALRMLRRIMSADGLDETHMNTLFSQLDIMDEAERLWLDAYKQAVRNNAAVEVDRLQNQIYEEGRQSKSADPVTYDDNGDVIPLSERFNQENQDIRFSLNEPVERVKDLIAVHNLKPDDIRNTFELGGFPMPSIAVTKDSMGHDMYGDITLMFHSDTIDPKKKRTNEVFGGDAYTPVFPRIHYKASSKVEKRLSDLYYEWSQKYGYDTVRPFYEYGQTLQDALDRAGGEAALIDQLKSDSNLMRMYLRINDNDVEDVMKITEITMPEGEVDLSKRLIDALGEEDIRSIVPEGITGREALQYRREWVETHKEQLEAVYRDYFTSSGVLSEEDIEAVIPAIKPGEYAVAVRKALDYLRHGATTTKEEKDYEATTNAIKQAAEETGYDEWIDDLFKGVEEKRGLRNDRDMFTASGNRRKWESLYEPVTLDGVVRVMSQKLSAGANGLLGANPKGASQKSYRSLDEIRADEDRLQQLPEEDFKALEEAAVQKLSDVCVDIVDSNSNAFQNRFGAALDVGEYIAEILNVTKDRATIKRKLQSDYNLKVSDTQMDALMEAIDEIANLPTGYFEAKPRRAVGFDEVKAAIIPASTDEDIKKGFNDRGIQMYEYDPDVEGDRTEKVNEAATEQDLRFSITDSEGNALSENQANFFRDSKMVDKEGRLMPMYHGTQNEFTEFDITKAYPGTLGRGFYFSDSEAHSGVYGKIGKYYLNLVNPLMPDTNEITKDQLRRFVAELAEDEDYGIENYGYGATVDSVTDDVWGKSDFRMLHDLNLSCVGDLAEAVKVFNRVNDTDYDGIITNTETLAFYPEQVKSTDNLNPTLSKDTRYSITDSDGNELSDGQVEYFKNSQARDEQGRLVPVYHSTYNGGFTIFDPSYSEDGRSLFFTNYRRMSESYSKGDGKTTSDIDPYNMVSSTKTITSVYDLPSFGIDMPVGQIEDRISNVVIRDSDGNEIYSGESFYDAAYNLMPYIEQKGYDDESVLQDMYIDYNDENMEAKMGAAWEIFNEAKKYGYSYSMDFANIAGTYSVYLDLESPLIIDNGHSDHWSSIKIPKEIRQEMWDYFGFMFSAANTRQYAEYAYEKGYDGVIIRNVVDYGQSGYGNEPADVYIAFSGEQVKDIRNTDPTNNPDIRYSFTDEEESKSKKDYEHVTDMSYEELLMYEDMIANASESYDIESAFGKAFDGEKVSNFYSALTEEVGMVFDDEILEEGRMRMAKSKADFWSNLNTKWQERWETKGEVLDTKSVKTNVRNLIRGVMNNSNTDRQYKTELVNKTLMDMRVAYQLMKQDRTDIASALLYHSALRMITDVDFIQDDTEYQEYKGIRDYLRKAPITVGEDYWQSKAFQQFRKEHYGILKLRKGTSSNIDKVYGQLEELYPHIFNETEREKHGFGDSEEDLLQYIGFVTEQNMQPFMEAYSSEECAEWAFEIADDLYEIMENGKGVTSLADRYKAKYDTKAKAMKTRHAEAILRVRKQKQAAIDALKEHYNERLDKQRELAKDAIRKEREKFRQQKQAEKERTKERKLHSKYFDSIVESHKTLSDRLLTNTKDKHIPEQYKKDLAELLAAFDLQTVASKKLEIRNGLYYRQNYQSQKTIRMKALQETLANIQADSQLFYVNDSITEIIDRLLGKNAEGKTDPLKSVEGRTIDELTSSELKDIDKLLKALIHEFNNYESVRTGAKRQQAADIATSQIDSCLDHAGKFGEGLDYQNFLGALDNILNLDEVTPAYMFRQIDPQNNGIGMMFKELRRSFGKYVRNQNQLNEWMNEIIGEYNNKGRLWNKYGSALEEWRVSTRAKEFQLTNGNVKLTPAQMMSIYCLSHRQQAYDHMTGAGIVVQPVSFQAKMASDLRKKANYALPIILTDADIKLITSKLTPDQIKVADKLQELMATKMAEWGNEASMSVMGIRLFEDPDYFPIKSDKAALEKDFSAEQFMDCIRNFGFTKAVQPGARNAIAIGDIFDVVAEHCNNMNLYNAYSEAMNDFMKVYNFHAMREDGSDYSVEQAIAHAYSKKATTFISSFMKDLNGNVSKERTTGIEQMMNDSLGKAKKASVFANGRVALQQPTALMRAFAVISPKYLKGVKAGKATMQEMFEHSPIALWKSWGYYDINMGKSIEDLMMNNGSWAEDKMSDLYGELDNRTWAIIWTMCKNEVEDKHKDVEVGSDEYWELVSERFDEVVDLTQVVDSPFHRSHAMRSKSTLTKMATAFMAEPTLTFNMLRDGFIRAREEYRLGNKKAAAKIAGRTLSVFALSAWATAAAAAIWDAVRGKTPGGDDDDEQGFFDMWFDNMIENLKDNINLLNNIYYIKDVVSLFQGWDQRNLGLQGWKHFADAYGQLTGRRVSSKLTWYENMLAGVGYLTGVPLKTMMNDGKAIFKMFGLSAPGFITDQLDKLDSIGSSTKDMNRGASSSSGISNPKTSSKSTAVNLWTYDNAPFRIEDGSAADNILNHFGINLTSAEIAAAEEKKIKAEREKKVEDIKAKTAGMSGVEKDKKVWSYISSQIKKEHGDMPVSSIVEAGDYNSIYEYREMYVAAGGNTDYFDERIFDASKKAMKKSIVYNPTDAQIEAQDNIRNYLTDHGMSETELSEIAYKSYTAKELKVAFRLNDEDAIVEELTPLVRAGLSLEDFHRIYDNRNSIDLKKYKESGGKYAEKLKSMGDYNWPCNGTITSTFGHRSSPGGIGSTNHQGIDIGASMGAPVTAADGGVVVRSGWYGGYGKTVQIQHDDGTITQYSHLSWWEPKVGDVVAQGQEIGKVGSTGNSTGPHLHFGVMKNGEYVDPMDYLNKKS